MRYAQVVNGVVVNVIVWDGSAPLVNLPGGLVQSDTLNIGDSYNGDLIAPPQLEQPA